MGNIESRSVVLHEETLVTKVLAGAHGGLVTVVARTAVLLGVNELVILAAAEVDLDVVELGIDMTC
jgi:hypothetical protein